MMLIFPFVIVRLSGLTWGFRPAFGSWIRRPQREKPSKNRLIIGPCVRQVDETTGESLSCRYAWRMRGAPFRIPGTIHVGATHGENSVHQIRGGQAMVNSRRAWSYVSCPIPRFNYGLKNCSLVLRPNARKDDCGPRALQNGRLIPRPGRLICGLQRFRPFSFRHTLLRCNQPSGKVLRFPLNGITHRTRAATSGKSKPWRRGPKE